jgi:hypothetical protein
MRDEAKERIRKELVIYEIRGMVGNDILCEPKKLSSLEYF